VLTLHYIAPITNVQISVIRVICKHLIFYGYQKASVWKKYFINPFTAVVILMRHRKKCRTSIDAAFKRRCLS